MSQDEIEALLHFFKALADESRRKHRGFCPSCCGRRSADVAAHLVEDVLPQVPIRRNCSPRSSASLRFGPSVLTYRPSTLRSRGLARLASEPR